MTKDLLSFVPGWSPAMPKTDRTSNQQLIDLIDNFGEASEALGHMMGEQDRRCRDEARAELIAALRAAHETTTVIDLDGEMWREIKTAIIESPRFVEMYAAGGMLNDGVSNVVAWLKESPEETKQSQPNSGWTLELRCNRQLMYVENGFETTPETARRAALERFRIVQEDYDRRFPEAPEKASGPTPCKHGYHGDCHHCHAENGEAPR